MLDENGYITEATTSNIWILKKKYFNYNSFN